MKINRYWAIALGMAFMFLFSGAPLWADDASRQADKIDKNELRRMVIEIIKENPKFLYDTINEYARKERTRYSRKKLEDNLKNRVQDSISPHNPIQGPKDAPITIMIYTDFECSFCVRGSGTIKELLKKYPKTIRIVLKNNPLRMHKNAIPAAQAALAAHKQGKFWPYYDLLFKNSRSLNDKKFIEFATQLSLDLKQFNRDRKSEEIKKQVEFDMAQAKKLKLTGTPSFVVNGVIIRGAQSLDYFSNIIDQLLAEKKKS